LGPAGAQVFRFSCQQKYFSERHEKLFASEKSLVTLATLAVIMSSSANHRRVEKQSILWHRFRSQRWSMWLSWCFHSPRKYLGILCGIIICRRTEYYSKNNLNRFALGMSSLFGINFHTLCPHLVVDDNFLNEDSFDFLLSAIRNFDASSVLPPEPATLHENVHKRVFMTYLRMSTHKESKVNILACYKVLKQAALFIVVEGSRFCHLFLRISRIVQQSCLQRS